MADKQSKNSTRADHLAPYQWKKGEASPHPAGRPRRELPSETIYKMLQAEYGPEPVKAMQKQMPEPWRSKDNLTIQEIMAWIQIRKSLTPPADKAREDTINRVEGKPAQKIIATGVDDQPIELKVEYDLKKLATEELKAIREKLAKAKK